jgi:nicotinamidase-related amidase
MPVTTLDPKTALIIVDLQKGIAALPVVHSMNEVVGNSRRLADAFRERGLPVVLVNVDAGAPGRTEQPRPARAFEPDWAVLLPELDSKPTDILVTKKSWGAFATTDLEQKLKSLGVTQVVITGVATSAGVESTARQAYEHGFNVTLATDAMTDMSQAAHEASIANIFPRIGETGTTEEIVDLLKGPRG